MGHDREHNYIPVLKRNLAERKIDRREFLRTATLLGMSRANPGCRMKSSAPSARASRRSASAWGTSALAMSSAATSSSTTA